jgi:hypothetical protein
MEVTDSVWAEVCTVQVPSTLDRSAEPAHLLTGLLLVLLLLLWKVEEESEEEESLLSVESLLWMACLLLIRKGKHAAISACGSITTCTLWGCTQTTHKKGFSGRKQAAVILERRLFQRLKL